MQDIPRNELLDKLAAGWKVRRKCWNAGIYSHRDEDIGIGMKGLIANDWEGKPPKPVCTANGCSIVHAFERLQEGAEFIRRPNWVQETGFYKQASYALTIDDILAFDWEVWR